MRFLLDMGISQSVATWLKSMGHDAVHLNDESLHLLKDLFILQKAIAEQRTILTTDMDFGQLLAFNKYHQASVIQLRTSVFTPSSIREKLKLVFERFLIQLEEGYIITVEDDWEIEILSDLHDGL